MFGVNVKRPTFALIKCYPAGNSLVRFLTFTKKFLILNSLPYSQINLYE